MVDCLEQIGTSLQNPLWKEIIYNQNFFYINKIENLSPSPIVIFPTANEHMEIQNTYKPKHKRSDEHESGDCIYTM